MAAAEQAYGGPHDPCGCRVSRGNHALAQEPIRKPAVAPASTLFVKQIVLVATAPKGHVDAEEPQVQAAQYSTAVAVLGRIRHKSPHTV